MNRQKSWEAVSVLTWAFLQEGAFLGKHPWRVRRLQLLLSLGEQSRRALGNGSAVHSTSQGLELLVWMREEDSALSQSPPLDIFPGP